MAAEIREREICIVILIGLPGSGKTSLCTALVEFLKASSRDNLHCAIPVCYDELIPADVLGSLDTSSRWKEARREVLRHVEDLICFLMGSKKYDSIVRFQGIVPQEQLLQITQCAEQRIFIIVDDNMYYRSMRYEYFQLARLLSLSFCQLYIECSVSDALVHNSGRGLTVPEEVITGMAQKLEPPDKQNTWENFSLEVPSEIWSMSKVKEISRFLNDAATHPVVAIQNDLEERQESRAACSTNVIHQVDIALRKLVGEKIRESSNKGLKKDSLQAEAKGLADARHLIFERIKTGDTLIPKEICESVELCHSDAGDQLNKFLKDLFL